MLESFRDHGEQPVADEDQLGRLLVGLRLLRGVVEYTDLIRDQPLEVHISREVHIIEEVEGEDQGDVHDFEGNLDD